MPRKNKEEKFTHTFCSASYAKREKFFELLLFPAVPGSIHIQVFSFLELLNSMSFGDFWPLFRGESRLSLCELLEEATYKREKK